MKDSSLKLLSKEDLIEIIKSEPTLKRMAFHKVLDMVNRKITSILDEQEELDFTTIEGRIKYFELEKQHQRWRKIQNNL